MSVFGSLFTAVSALSAQSQSIAMISNNIANVSTVGYKRTDASFTSLVTSESRQVIYSPGSVRAVQAPRISEQGILQQSSSGTDVALSGNGFFIVKKSATDSTAEPLYTRAGGFTEDSTGILKNSAGMFLFGWPLDQDGNLPASQADLSSLVPVNVAFIGGLTQPTQAASSALNLDSEESPNPYPLTDTLVDPNFSRDIRVFDSLGAGHGLKVSFKKHESPTAIATGNVDVSEIIGPLSNNGFASTDSFDIDVGGVSATITLSGDMGQMISDINSIVDGNGDLVAFAKIDEETGFLTIKARNIGDDVTLTDGSGAPLAGGLGLGGAIGVTAAPATAPTLLTALENVPSTEGWWEVIFSTPAGSIISQGSVNFNGDGTLNATPSNTSGQVIVDLTSIDFGNGSEPQDIEFDISGFTQFASDYNVVSSNQNGAQLGLRTGVTVDVGGFVTAQFSNGETKRLYKLAVATFANANGLDELTGNVYRQTDFSGTVNLREPGVGSAGQVAGGALEASNVDLASEFSKMIVTQRAYSANTKVISTADQMTQELLQLR